MRSAIAAGIMAAIGLVLVGSGVVHVHGDPASMSWLHQLTVGS